MPIVSTLGAASSRGFGEFNAQSLNNYVENVFTPYVYNGAASAVSVSTDLTILDTVGWSGYSYKDTGATTIRNCTTDSSGNVYIVGTVNDGIGKAFVAKYDSSGALQWQRYLFIASSSGNAANGIALDGSGNVFICGQLYDNPPGITVGFVTKYNSSGTIQWQKKISENNGSSAVTLKGIALDSSGNIYACGQVYRSSPSADVSSYLVKLNSSGTFVSNVSYQNDVNTLKNIFENIKIDSSDNIYCVGSHYNATATSEYPCVMKFNTSLTLQWQKALANSNSVVGPRTFSSVDVSSAGDVYVTGSTTTGYVYFVKYNSSGTLQFQKYITLEASSGEFPRIVIDSSDNIYVNLFTGVSSSLSGLIGGVLKLDTSGVIQWQRNYTVSSGTVAYSGIAVTSTGNLYLSTSSQYFIKIKTDGSTKCGNVTGVSMFAGIMTIDTSTANTGADATASTVDVTIATMTATDAAGTATASSSSQLATSANTALVWIKSRSVADNHSLFDTTRGALNRLSSNLTTASTSVSSSLIGFTSSGFALGRNAAVNTSGSRNVAWTFIKRQKFFDIVTYTGNGSNRTISHNLGSVPGMILIKSTETGFDYAWQVYHRALANTEYLVLNTTAAKATGTTRWNSTTPTDTVFSLGTDTSVNENGTEYIAYLFASDAGGFGLYGSDSIINCDAVTTSAGGTVTATIGWEPQFVLLKSTSSGTNWFIWDNIRGMPVGGSDFVLYPNGTTAESAPGNNIDITPTGFILNATGSQTYVYMAIRRGPMKVPTDGTKVFIPTVYTGTNVDNRLVDTTIPPDMVWVRQRNDTVLGGMVVGDRLRGNPYLLTGATAAEVNDADSFMTPTSGYGNSFSAMNGFGCGNDPTSKLNINTTASNHIAEAFKRAPGFFDMVAYTGTGANRTISHNLGVVPQLIMIKQRASTTEWAVYSSDIANTEYLVLDTTAGKASGATYWNSTTPTSTAFSVGTSASVNTNAATYIAYLFATCAGVSKIGSYTGTGTTQQIDCGFNSGARFVLIKRTDSTGDWYVYDTARGIVAGDDPYILLNSTAAEVTNTDYVDTYSAGFELSSTAPAGLNANGGTFIFLAIA